MRHHVDTRMDWEIRLDNEGMDRELAWRGVEDVPVRACLVCGHDLSPDQARTCGSPWCDEIDRPTSAEILGGRE